VLINSTGLGQRIAWQLLLARRRSTLEGRPAKHLSWLWLTTPSLASAVATATATATAKVSVAVVVVGYHTVIFLASGIFGYTEIRRDPENTVGGES
jgi:hypothetical protein